MPEGAEVQGEGAMFRLPALAAFAVPVPASAAMQPRRTAVRGRPRMIRRCAREEQRGGSARRRETGVGGLLVRLQARASLIRATARPTCFAFATGASPFFFPAGQRPRALVFITVMAVCW